MSNIFLTGATGFIGSHLAHALAERGHELTLLLRNISRQPVGDRPPLPKNARLIYGELHEPASYSAALSDSEIVIHLAADYRIGLANAGKPRRAMFQTNVGGTLALADAALHKVERFIYASTTAAFGETHGAFPDESHRHNGEFRCYYEESKHIAHRCLEARRERGLPLTIATLGGVFGPGDTSSLTQAMRDFLRDKLPIQPDSRSRFQLCHVRHIVNAFELLVQHPAPAPNYLFTGQDFSMPEIMARLATLSAKVPPKKIAVEKLHLPAAIMDLLGGFGLHLPLSKEVVRIMDGSTYMYSSHQAQTELGWQSGDVEQELTDYMQALIHSVNASAPTHTEQNRS